MNIHLADVIPDNPLPGECWVDSHVHFDDFDRDDKCEEIIRRAEHAGVEQLVAIGGSDEANERAVRMATSHPDRVFAVVGYDRDHAGRSVDVSAVRQWMISNPQQVVGVGECGLDYHYHPETAPAQRTLFEIMLTLAAETTKPMVIHSRDADDDTIALVRDFIRAWKGDPAYPGVLHCFTGNYEFSRKLLDLGLLISFSGILTFRNAEALRDVARKLPLDRILIETDAPYLAPVPHRGKTNEPAWVPKVAETLASIRSDALQTISRQTSANARRLFALSKRNAT
ncbi:MAG TPA: TatD family hydrolase [Kiritimatiellia bacterium]|nr:TatD family hydrolase [Kiritimatiellia bacterium]HMO98395.1 TatD family hydrolase [Kiritimatiellia bacterium]HMP96448.1 TatD family hydrolase [Kiritimatiellia bacterium]